MPHHETPLDSRSFGTLAYEYDEQVLKYEDAVRALARLEQAHRNVSTFLAERDEAMYLARAIRLELVKKLIDLDTRIGLSGPKL